MHRCYRCRRASDDVRIYRFTRGLAPMHDGCAMMRPPTDERHRELRVIRVATEVLYPKALPEVERRFARLNQ